MRSTGGIIGIVLWACLVSSGAPAQTQQGLELAPAIKPGELRVGEADSRRIEEGLSQGGIKPIYGKDDRMDWGTLGPNQRVKKRAAASVALFSEASLNKAGDGGYKLNAKSIGEQLHLCPKERFAKQLTAAFCSGTLVAKDVVATAGHCIREVSKSDEAPELTRVQFVFGYYAESENEPGRVSFNDNQVYRGSSIIGGVLKEFLAGGEDWALIRLDRQVPRSVAEPVESFRSRKIPLGAPVYVIGYPSGLPLKYAPGAKVTENTPLYFFTANLDTFGGNSGSGVFDVRYGRYGWDSGTR